MLLIYTVFDKAVNAFMQPFFVRATGEAIRTFSDAVNEPSSPYGRHPADFELYGIGQFSPETGVIRAMDPVRVITALDCLNKM